MVEGLLFVDQAEGAHAETAGERLAELQVALLVRRDGARHVVEQRGTRLAGERLEGVQTETAHPLLVKWLEQVDRPQAARVDGDRLLAVAAHRRQRRRQPRGHRIDGVVRHGQPEGVCLAGDVAQAKVWGADARVCIVVVVHADGGDGEAGLVQPGKERGPQASGADHTMAIRGDVQAYALSGCGPPGGWYRACSPEA